MAVVMISLERYTEALAVLKKVYAGRKQLLGEDDPDTLDTNYEMGDIHFIEKRYQEAVKILQPVFRSRKRVLGKHDTETLDWLVVQV